MEIAAFIPVYLQAKRAVEIARRLASEAEEGEIILVIDGETTEDIAVALRELGGHPRVRVISGGPHLGKAEALNRAVSTTGADILVFIDNDIEIPAEARILEGSLRVLGENDIAEMPKVGRGKGPLARMVIYEFFSNVIGTQYLVRKTGRFPSMNGAAFTVRRELFDKLGGFRALINEDMDFAARAYFEGARFGFDPEMTVRNEVPESLKTWLRQRKRWSINSSLWSMTYSRRIIAHDAASRKFFLGSALVFPLPTLALLAGTFLPLIPVALLHGDGMASAGAVLAGLILVYGPVVANFRRHSRLYHSPFGLLSFLVYSLIYLPIWGLASLMGAIKLASGRYPDLDWKHDGEGSVDALRLGNPRFSRRGGDGKARKKSG